MMKTNRNIMLWFFFN